MTLVHVTVNPVKVIRLTQSLFVAVSSTWRGSYAFTYAKWSDFK